ncbi:MAG: hypothetical protein QOC81_1405 [Thermoanaerobaculia bacterium]|jgi:hypothetical protein|nr:hypothetical protein [Thermoanaerobaculia bacterium]
MKNRILILAILCCTVHSLLSAATVKVKVNSDGSFSPPFVTVASGDTVEWTLNGAADSIIPVNWDGASAGVCSTVKPYSATDANDFTGPMPLAVSGIFSLSPIDSGFTVVPTGSTCTVGGQPAAIVGSQMLCRGGLSGATLDATWQDPSLTGVFIRLLWKDVQKAPGTVDSSFDFTVLDREMNKAVKNGKVYSLAIRAGDDGTPSWLFTNGVTPLQLQDQGDDESGGCGVRMTLGNPTEIAYQNRYFDLLRKVAAHVKSRADWYRALAYIKPSGANLQTHENRLPKHCSAGCPCNTQIFAQNGYTPAGLYAFYQAQTSLLVSEFPNKTMVYALIQDGFPRVNNNGGYETVDGSSSGGGALPGGVEQTQTILNNGQAAHGLLFAVAHNGLQTKKTDNCLNNINGLGCPNKWVLQEGLEGQVTGWQTTNSEKVANASDTDSALQNALSNSQGVYVELYEERFWEAVHQPNGIINPAGSGKTMTQWANDLHSRRRTLFPSLGDPFPTTYRHTFTRTLAGAGNQTFYYIHGSKCGIGPAAPGAVVVLPLGGTAPKRQRSVHH